MPITFFRPHPLLRDVVARYYVHEADARSMSQADWRIVPDGELKLIFPYRGGIACTIGDAKRWHPESRLIVSGMRDTPGTLHFPSGVGAVVAVLHPDGFHRLTGVTQAHMINATLDGEELFGGAARGWHEWIEETGPADARVRCLETVLVRLTQRADRRDASFAWALQQIRRSAGRVRMESLVRALGWSRRRMHRAFVARVGIGPKRLASVLRFQAVYRHLTRTPPESRDGRFIYDYYFDQSHFLKDFKRYSGITPRLYDRDSDYGRFYIP